ncbi:MAG TPA: 2Fe-2S iron-sulfur cluster-binding protein [Solirubrobacteraceae bacterium]|nr:2Fe-2S iron-sulfur cluster-binding protein [Solirubrobacteraceae bacterium]
MRLPPRAGERIRRAERLTFTFDGREIEAFAGDTLGSALYADGVRVFTRSFKYHRPRGLMCCSGSCASCLMEVDGEPSVRVCTRPVEGGEEVRSQVVTGSLERDPLRVVDRVGGPFTPVGFYYRTGIRPKRAWPYIERALRRMTGLGRAGDHAQPRRTDVEHRHVDVLVVGGGRSGRASALHYARGGREVVLVDERPESAGLALDGVEVLAPARALGVFEGRLVPVHAGDVVHRIRARHVVIATGTVEQPLLFDGNDLPGVMTPGAVTRMIDLWAIRPGSRAVVLAADETAHAAADRLRDAGADVAEIVDLRSGTPPTLRARGRRGRLTAVEIDGRRVACDLLVASAGRQPAYSLIAQAGGTVRFDAAGGVFAPEDLPDGIEAVGSVLGSRAGVLAPPPPEHAGGRCFVCHCEDVTAKDLRRAVAEGFDDIEIAKRYTTVTMGPCQGRLCQLGSVRLLAQATGTGEAALGTTTARPPWTPTPLGALAGRPHVPGKRTPLHGRHVEAGASMVWTGPWRRPDHYGDAAAEIRAVHAAAGIMDVSTLGKLVVSGADAQRFLDGVFPNRIVTLEPGRVRYVIFNTESGRVIDDGTVVRLADDSYFVSTSSGGVDVVYESFGLWRDERGLDVEIVNASGALAAIAMSGPASRRILARLTDLDVSNEAFPFLGARQGVVAGVPALVVRIGFLGELGYELHFPSSGAVHVWDALLEAGAGDGVVPVGVEALKVLRLEKGHVIVGIDTDPETTMLELGMDRMVVWDKGPFVGRDALERMHDRGADRRLVGFRSDQLPREGTAVLVDGEIGGRVTSARSTADAGGVIGLAYVPAAIAHDGARFAVDMGAGATADATVHVGAFVDADGERLRS